ncbi:hypothetical protein ABZV60_34810 [Streptomyces sp. NPDC004787]|uniref:hypothetical protein n=1 Tax=Streptomyces sp. NPDC004787 TaxID=3154291 RepID=UPI0033AFF695
MVNHKGVAVLSKKFKRAIAGVAASVCVAAGSVIAAAPAEASSICTSLHPVSNTVPDLYMFTCAQSAGAGAAMGSVHVKMISPGATSKQYYVKSVGLNFGPNGFEYGGWDCPVYKWMKNGDTATCYTNSTHSNMLYGQMWYGRGKVNYYDPVLKYYTDKYDYASIYVPGYYY